MKDYQLTLVGKTKSKLLFLLQQYGDLPTRAKSVLHSLEGKAGGIGIHDNPEYMCFNQNGDIPSLKGGSQKLLDKFTYIGSSISSTEHGIN